MQYCLDIFLFILVETQAEQKKWFDQNGKGQFFFSANIIDISHFIQYQLRM